MDNRLTLTILPPGLRLLRSAQAPPQGQPGPARATTRALRLDGWRRIPARWGHATPEGDGFHVAQGLARQFGDNGVRVAEQQDQHPDPGEFSGIDTDHGDGVGHLQKSLNYLFGHGLGNVEH